MIEQSQQATATQPQPYQKDVKPKVPVFVTIIGWLMLLDGIRNLFLAVPFLLLFGIVKSGLILIKGIGLVFVSFGIRYMRRWALYTFTGLTALAVIAAIYSFATSPTKDFSSVTDIGIEIGIQALVLAYFWKISKRFN